jgi:hypothetical protein
LGCRSAEHYRLISVTTYKIKSLVTALAAASSGTDKRKVSKRSRGGSIMAIVDRRLALIGLGAASAVLISGAPQAHSQPARARTRTIAQGVREIVYGEGPSIIPGYKAVRLRDIVVQPGARVAPGQMHPMVCHMAQGELEVVRTNPNETFVARQYHVWTCASGMTEGVVNRGRTVAVMRITDLLA